MLYRILPGLVLLTLTLTIGCGGTAELEPTTGSEVQGISEEKLETEMEKSMQQMPPEMRRKYEDRMRQMQR